MNTAKISSKFQIHLPKEIQETMGVSPGNTLVLIPKGRMTLLVQQMSAEELFGAFPDINAVDYRDRSDRE